MIRQTGGDDVSKTLLGAYNYFKRIDTQAESNKKHILELISKCNSSVGIVAKPAFSEDHKHFEYILSVAKYFGGIIFNGSDAISHTGEIILSSNGECTTNV